MNNQIRELAEQAGFYFYDMHNVDGQDLGETVEADSWHVPEAFAKLIVKECMLCCERVISDPVRPESVDTWLNGGLSCIDEIKEHFGVEE